jgi:hypothetical protein
MTCFFVILSGVIEHPGKTHNLYNGDLLMAVCTL